MSDQSNNSEVCLDTFKRHWAEAQIDGPMQTVARYDDVAKLLITIGGFTLAALAALIRAVGCDGPGHAWCGANCIRLNVCILRVLCRHVLRVTQDVRSTDSGMS